MPVTDQPFIRLHADDDVVVCRRSASVGAAWSTDDGMRVAARVPIELGHKMAIRSVRTGARVPPLRPDYRFRDAGHRAGEWVHQHNLGVGELAQDYEYATDVPPPPEPVHGRTFMGYRRSDGRAATRNYIGIVSTVNCSATSSRYIAEQFDEAVLADYPNIDGVVALAHKGGRAMEYGGYDHASWLVRLLDLRGIPTLPHT